VTAVSATDHRFVHRGRCHCGNLGWTLASDLAVDELPARACQCRFCLRHGALTTSDPAGELRFAVDDRSRLLRYRFATGSADFLVCLRCGVYVGALMEDGGRWFAIANRRTLEHGATHRRPASQPMRYDGEDAAARRARRRARWSPSAALT
jgi:hypothetical protein